MTRPDSSSVVTIGVFAAFIIILVYCGRLLQSQTQWLRGLDARVEARDKLWNDAFLRTEEAQHRILEILRKQQDGRP